MVTLDCQKCCKEFPVSDFTDLAAGQICRWCLAGINSAKASETLQKQTKSMINQLASIESPVADIPQLKHVMTSIYRNFGGMEGFAQHTHFLIMELSKRRPLPSSVAQLMINLMKLHQSIETAEEQINARNMTDEQLAKARELAVMKLLVEAAGDPRKLENLAAMMGRQGIKLQAMTPEERIRVMAGEVLPIAANLGRDNERHATQVDGVDAGGAVAGDGGSADIPPERTAGADPPLQLPGNDSERW